MCNPNKMVFGMGAWSLLFMSFFLVSCWQQDPSGSYQGEIKDWVYEVFEGPLVTQGHDCQIEVVLKQVPEGFLANLTFQHPKMDEVLRRGKWKVEDGYRSVFLKMANLHPNIFLLKAAGVTLFKLKRD